MNPLELRYALYLPLVGPNAPALIQGAELLGPQEDGTVRMRVVTKDPYDPDTITKRTYTVTIEEE